MKKSILFIVCILFAVVLLPSCGVEDSVNNAVNSINTAIGKLQTESIDWRTALNQTSSDLKKAGQTTLANEVQNVADRAVASSGEEVRCNTEFFARRTQEVLAAVVRRITTPNDKTGSISVPHVCHWSPDSVDLNLEVDRRSKLEISGYDLGNKTPTGESLKLTLVSADGSKTDVSKYINIVTFQHIVINAGGNGLQFSDSSSQLLLTWEGNQLSSVPIIVPHHAWYRNDETGQPYNKTFIHISDNTSGMKGGKQAMGTYTIDVPHARIYRVDFRSEGQYTGWNYNPDGGYAGWTKILPDGKSFLWRRKWDGLPTTEIYTAYYEIYK